MTSVISLMPDVTALNATNSAPVACAPAAARASSCPCRAGPRGSASAARRDRAPAAAGRPGPSRCAWPTNSSSVRGRIRSASGVPGKRRRSSASGATSVTRVSHGVRRHAALRSRISAAVAATLSELTPARIGTVTRGRRWRRAPAAGRRLRCRAARASASAKSTASSGVAAGGDGGRDPRAAPRRAAAMASSSRPARDRHAERAAHRPAQRLPAAGMRGPVEREHAGGAERVGAADDAADVAGILDVDQADRPGALRCRRTRRRRSPAPTWRARRRRWACGRGWRRRARRRCLRRPRRRRPMRARQASAIASVGRARPRWRQPRVERFGDEMLAVEQHARPVAAAGGELAAALDDGMLAAGDARRGTVTSTIDSAPDVPRSVLIDCADESRD